MISFSTHIKSTDAEWIVFVHGAGGSSSIWHKQVKPFSKEFNLLILDLRGHGGSTTESEKSDADFYTFDAITDDIEEVLEHLDITAAHYVGISLGTILIRNLSERYPHRVKSMILGGAILKLDIRSQILMWLGITFKSVLPYMVLYKFFAFIILPRRNHRASRKVFVKEAKKLYQKEFIRWFKLTAEVNTVLRSYRDEDSGFPVLYIMGEQDYLFLPTIKEVCDKFSNSTLHVIPSCGHIVNIEGVEEFNKTVLSFCSKAPLR